MGDWWDLHMEEGTMQLLSGSSVIVMQKANRLRTTLTKSFIYYGFQKYKMNCPQFIMALQGLLLLQISRYRILIMEQKWLINHTKCFLLISFHNEGTTSVMGGQLISPCGDIVKSLHWLFNELHSYSTSHIKYSDFFSRAVQFNEWCAVVVDSDLWLICVQTGCVFTGPC